MYIIHILCVFKYRLDHIQYINIYIYIFIHIYIYISYLYGTPKKSLQWTGNTSGVTTNKTNGRPFRGGAYIYICIYIYIEHILLYVYIYIHIYIMYHIYIYMYLIMFDIDLYWISGNT